MSVSPSQLSYHGHAKEGEGVDAVSFFFLDDQIPASDVCSCMSLYLSCAFWDKFGDDQFLWFRGITPQVFKPLLTENAYFFQLLSTIKVKFVDKMKQGTYLCVILQVQRKQK